MSSNFRIPSPEELYALEQWAHRERSKALARLIVVGAKALKELVVKTLTSRGPTARGIRRQVVRHA